MAPANVRSVPDFELDVRSLRKPDKHPAIFDAYNRLPVGATFVLVNNHDPRHLRDEFEIEHPGSYGWEYLDKGPEAWRIRISKLAATPVPRVLFDTTTVGGGRAEADVVWKLQTRDRDLDSNIIALPPGGTIPAHAGPDLDVLIHVVRGGGRLVTELDSVEFSPGAVMWLPRHSRRQFEAGPDGLGYLTVHRRRQSLPLAAPSERQRP